MKVIEIAPKQVDSKNYELIDVRTEEEFYGELGHVPGSTLITLGEDLDKYLESKNKLEKIVFICRSGNRSGQAAELAMEKGFTDVLNMSGGMLLWNELGLETEK